MSRLFPSSVATRVLARALSLPPARDRDVTETRDVRVPMDDGVDLLADIYTPAASGPHPTVLVRSPYGRRGPFGLLLGRVFAERGYRTVVQSCRGTFGSGGVFEPNRNERADGLATIRWLEAQPWFDGRLAMNGPSYLGGVQWAVGDSAGPSLRALCTHVTYSDITRHWFAGGSFSLGDAIEWTTMVSEQERGRFRLVQTILGTRERRIDRVIDHLPVQDLDQLVVGHRVPAWREIVEHPGASDLHWEPANHSARVGAVTAPVLQVGGWYDIFLPVQLADHRALVAAGRRPRLVIGPWTHTASKAFATQVTESVRWLDRNVLDTAHDGGSEDGAPVRVFVMGAGVWRDLPTWPPPEARATPWYLHRGGRLDPSEPGDEGADPYTYDPNDATPVIGGTLLRRTGGRREQRRTEARADVVVFTGDVLDADLDVVGEVTADVRVSCDLEHFDVFVRLCDVDEKGRSFNVCDGLERVSPERHPRPPDGVWSVRVALWATAQRFRAGHRIRVQVSSGAHPRFARNLGTGEPLATATTTRVAHVSIHHDHARPSAIVLPVVAGHAATPAQRIRSAATE
jgi:putative CocE/NonD family hydrolase